MPKISKWQDKWINKNNWPESRFAKRVYSFLKNKKLSTMLDLGCGGGRDSVYFSQHGLAVTALDAIATGQQQAKLKAHNIKFIKGDIRNIRLKPNSFDIIYAHLSLHYFNDNTTDRIFKKLYSVLKPGGYLFVKCKSIADPFYGKGRKIEDNYYDFGHIRHFFSKQYMAEKLKDFKVIKISKTNSYKHPGRSSFIEAFARKK